MEDTYLLLTEISFLYGLIGLDEFQERLRVLRWLSSPDGRDPRSEDEVGSEEGRPEADGGLPQSEPSLDHGQAEDDGPLQFIPRGLKLKWVFTKSDPDPYPSVPHAHLNHQNQERPKLNPYTGRAFEKKHLEDVHRRLDKAEMRALWMDPKFRDFARDQVMWFLSEHPEHVFRVKHPLRFPVW